MEKKKTSAGHCHLISWNAIVVLLILSCCMTLLGGSDLATDLLKHIDTKHASQSTHVEQKIRVSQ